MTRYSPDPKRWDTLHPHGKVSRIIQSLARSSFAKSKSELEEPASPALEVSEEAVTQFIWAWRERISYLPSEVLLDPAWAMLLELLQAEIQGRRVSLARICKVSGVSTNSAVRWLSALEGRELTVRRVDPKDAGNEFVELSPKASSALRRYFHDVVQSDRQIEDLM